MLPANTVSPNVALFDVRHSDAKFKFYAKNGAERNVTMNYDTTGDSLRLILDSSLMYGDTVTITAGQTTRVINVGIWGQP